MDKDPARDRELRLCGRGSGSPMRLPSFKPSSQAVPKFRLSARKSCLSPVNPARRDSTRCIAAKYPKARNRSVVSFVSSGTPSGSKPKFFVRPRRFREAFVLPLNPYHIAAPFSAAPQLLLNPATTGVNY